jgi:hypothetical protein
MSIAVTDLTQATLEGTGIFDVLMRANKAHLESEFNKGRIKGPEYSTVYLGSLTQVMQTALQLLLTKDKTDLENQLIEKQIELAQIQIDKTVAEKLQVEAQTLLINQQKANLVAEALNIPKQGALLDAQKDVQVEQRAAVIAETLRTGKQSAQIEQETLNLASQKLQIEAQTQLVGQQKTNLIAEAANLPKQGLLIDAQKDVQLQQKLNLTSQKLQVEAETVLTAQKTTNAVTENTVLVAQECKLRAEYDLTMGSVLKTAQETSLLSQKTATERAQITAMGVDEDSVVGRQKALYQAQTTGFTRDAEQKAAKLLVDSWNVRRTTDEGTVADSVNMLNDATVGRAVNKLLDGVGA